MYVPALTTTRKVTSGGRHSNTSSRLTVTSTGSSCTISPRRAFW
jgi:hypothetical protein